MTLGKTRKTTKQSQLQSYSNDTWKDKKCNLSYRVIVMTLGKTRKRQLERQQLEAKSKIY